MRCLAANTFNARIAVHSKLNGCPKEGTVKTQCEAVNYLPETCVTYDIVAESDANMLRSTQAFSKSPLKYAEAL